MFSLGHSQGGVAPAKRCASVSPSDDSCEIKPWLARSQLCARAAALSSGLDSYGGRPFAARTWLIVATNTASNIAGSSLSVAVGSILHSAITVDWAFGVLGALMS